MSTPTVTVWWNRSDSPGQLNIDGSAETVEVNSITNHEGLHLKFKEVTFALGSPETPRLHCFFLDGRTDGIGTIDPAVASQIHSLMTKMPTTRPASTSSGTTIQPTAPDESWAH